MTRLVVWLEGTFLLGGALLLALFLLALVHQQFLAAWDRAAFAPASPAPARAPLEAARPGARSEPAAPADLWSEPAADTREWSPARIASFLAARAPLGAERLALLELPALDLSVVVLAGSDEWSLNRGVGHIPGTASPGEAGNVGIAGHRDGFFRALQRAQVGDVARVRLPGAERASAYRIEWIRIVRPEDTWVLAPTAEPSLTLVTCHPFYFVGHAPERYVVRAVADGARAPRP